MKWLSNYTEELGLAFSEAASILEKLPASFRQLAIDYLDRFNVLKEGRKNNYICYLLPLWLNKLTDVPLKQCREFVVANIFGMMYYHLIDAAMDKRDEFSVHRLPLAEFIHLEFVNLYSKSFPANSSFWDYYRKFIGQWAEAVSTENTIDAYYTNPVLMGHKAAPVKLCIVATLLLSQREELIPDLEQSVDTVLITLQMLDDWEDWEVDLQEGNYNSLVSLVQQECNIPEDRGPSPAEMNQALCDLLILSTYAKQAKKHHDRLSTIESLVPDLYDFHLSLVDNLSSGALHFEKERQLLLQGGLNYYLSKIIKFS